MRRIHDVGSGGRLVCKICNKELKDERNLREHSKLHTGELDSGYGTRIIRR